jgi:hypothetical protein
MPLTLGERKQYLKDRAANAFRMVRNRNFKLFRDSLVFEVNHGIALFKMWRNVRNEPRDGADSGSGYVNRCKVLPVSWRPTTPRKAQPGEIPADTAVLAKDLRKILSTISIDERRKPRRKWSKSPS